MDTRTDTPTTSIDTLIARVREAADAFTALNDRYEALDFTVTGGQVCRAKEAYCAALLDWLDATGGWDQEPDPVPVAPAPHAATRGRKLSISFHYRQIGTSECARGTTRQWTVEVRDRHTSLTVGRVDGGFGQWIGYRIGAEAATAWHSTREAAAAAMLLGEDWRLRRRAA